MSITRSEIEDNVEGTDGIGGYIEDEAFPPPVEVFEECNHYRHQNHAEGANEHHGQVPTESADQKDIQMTRTGNPHGTIDSSGCIKVWRCNNLLRGRLIARSLYLRSLQGWMIQVVLWVSCGSSLKVL